MLCSFAFLSLIKARLLPRGTRLVSTLPKAPISYLSSYYREDNSILYLDKVYYTTRGHVCCPSLNKV